MTIAPTMSPQVTVSLNHAGDLSVNLGRHDITVPLDERGLKVLHSILTARAQRDAAPIGTEGNPIQYMVDQWLKDGGDPRAHESPLTVGLDLEV